MLTTEQCIEIAEKGWLVSLEELEEQYEDDRGELSYYVWDTPEWKSDLSFAEWIDRRVNSWEGFGRTVEAMAEKSVYLKNSFHNQLKAYFAQYLIDTSSDKLNGLFEMIHLAALEAINDNQ